MIILSHPVGWQREEKPYDNASRTVCIHFLGSLMLYTEKILDINTVIFKWEGNSIFMALAIVTIELPKSMLLYQHSRIAAKTRNHRNRLLVIFLPDNYILCIFSKDTVSSIREYKELRSYQVIKKSLILLNN